MKTSHKGRWLLFLCIGLLYLWVLWQGWLSWQAPPFPTVRGRAVLPMSPPPFDTTLISAALFSVFLLLHMSLSWIRFSTRRHYWYVLYFAIQGLLVLLLVLLWEGDHLFIALYLYLALIGEAIIVLRQSSLVGVVIGFLVLFILSQGISFTETKTRWFDWSLYVMLLIPLVPFGVSYVQVRRRERDQLLLHELAIAHAQLKTSATQIAELTLLTERQRMARELHDTLAQGLAGMILQFRGSQLPSFAPTSCPRPGDRSTGHGASTGHPRRRSSGHR